LSKSRRSFSASASMEVPMPESNGTPAAATFDELVAACPGIDTSAAEDAMFVADCQRKKLTASAATAEWCKTLQSRAAAAREDAKKATTVVKPASGVAAVNDAPNGADNGAAAGDPVAAWNEAVEAAMPKNGNSRDRAIKATVKAQPELHKAYVQAVNKSAGRSVPAHLS
jgi:hypothetical protein